MRSRMPVALRRTLIILFTLFVLDLLLAVVLFAGIKWKSSQLKGSLDLNLQSYMPSDVTPENNAYDELMEVGKLISKHFEDEYRSSGFNCELEYMYPEKSLEVSREQLEKLTQTVTLFEPQIAILDKILEKKYCMCFSEEGGSIYGVEHLVYFRKVCRLLEARALVAARKGDEDKVIESLKLMDRLGNILLSRPYSTIVHTVSINIKNFIPGTMTKAAWYLTQTDNFHPEKYASIPTAPEKISVDQLWKLDVAENHRYFFEGINLWGLSKHEREAKVEFRLNSRPDAWLMYLMPMIILHRKYKYIDLLSRWEQLLSGSKEELEGIGEDSFFHSNPPVTMLHIRKLEQLFTRLGRINKLGLAIQEYVNKEGALPETIEPFAEILGERAVTDPVSGERFIFRNDGYRLVIERYIAKYADPEEILTIYDKHL